MPFLWRRSEWYCNTPSAAIVNAVAIVTVSVNAFAVSACCENGDEREVWVWVRERHCL
jgi:hypothetical protein